MDGLKSWIYRYSIELLWFWFCALCSFPRTDSENISKHFYKMYSEEVMLHLIMLYIIIIMLHRYKLNIPFLEDFVTQY